MVCRVVLYLNKSWFLFLAEGNFIYFSMISKTTSEINAWHRKIYHLFYSISNFNSSKSNFIAFTDKVILKETLNLINMLPSWPPYYIIFIQKFHKALWFSFNVNVCIENKHAVLVLHNNNVGCIFLMFPSLSSFWFVYVINSSD